MIASLLNLPQTDAEWQRFGLAHALVHAAIRQALSSQKGIITGDYILDPINFHAVPEWLSRVQQTHIEMNSALGLQSSDLEGVDFTNKSQAEAWVYLNWQEDNAAMSALHI